GDRIDEHDIMVEVQNDKAEVEMPSPVSGTTNEMIVEEGTVAVVGDVLVRIERDDAADNEGQSTEKEAAPEEKQETEEQVQAGTAEAAQNVEKEPAKEESPKETQTGAGAQPQAKAEKDPNARVIAMPSVRKF